jgi:hypothetical protein
MASHRSTSVRHPAHGAARLRRGLQAALLAAVLALPGCGFVEDATPVAEAPAGTVMEIAEAQLPPVSKPIVGEVASFVAEPAMASKPPVSTNPAAVPVVSGKVRYGVPSAAALGAGGSLQGAVPFPQDDLWNRDVSQGPADPASDALIARIGTTRPLQLGFGRTEGVPYVVVAGTQPTVPLRTPDGVPRDWPLPTDATVSQDGTGRLVVLDRDAGRLYELQGAARAADGSWTADAAAAWALDIANGLPLDGALLRSTFTGLPMFAGLLRADEASVGVIRHALRVTVPWLRDAWLPPARRAPDGAYADASLPPIGMRLRLKAGVPIPDTLSLPARAILQALKTYGMVVVGTGPAWTIEGAPDARWDTVRLAGELAMVRGEHFEVLPMDGVSVVR